MTSWRSPGDVRFATADSNAPVPDVVNMQDVVLGAIDLAQPREAALVDIAVVARTVVDDGLGERGQHLRRHGRRPRRQQVALLGHLR